MNIYNTTKKFPESTWTKLLGKTLRCSSNIIKTKQFRQPKKLETWFKFPTIS